LNDDYESDYSISDEESGSNFDPTEKKSRYPATPASNQTPMSHGTPFSIKLHRCDDDVVRNSAAFKNLGGFENMGLIEDSNDVADVGLDPSSDGIILNFNYFFSIMILNFILIRK